MSSQAVKRPASVSLVVFLTWLVAIVTIIGGVVLLFASDSALAEAGVSSSSANLQGWIGIVLGLVIALFASALGHGSGFARLMISLLMVFRFVLGVFGIVALWGTGHFWGILLMTVFAALILYLLWNARAAAFFARS
ncbi:MAG: hypothetical protein R2720_11865 [Candidatus Nanopelagicales bacterium]